MHRLYTKLGNRALQMKPENISAFVIARYMRNLCIKLSKEKVRALKKRWRARKLLTLVQRRPDTISPIFLRKVSSSFVNGSRIKESMSISPTTSSFLKIGMTISDFTFALHGR